MSFAIAGRPVGPGNPTFVIAEIGVNHDGSLSRALELVAHAAAAGADAVKLQIFRATALMHPTARFATYQASRTDAPDALAMLRQYELPPLDICRIVEAIRQAGLIPLATPFSPSDVPLLEGFDLPATKIASPDLVNYPLLKRAAAIGRPLLLSTGAATLDEIATTAGWLRQWNAAFALLHCTSSYPTNPADANLCWIEELATSFKVPAGYSDHTGERLTGALAVMAGASVLEKHLTYDCSAPGPDHSSSADPDQFAEYVRHVRTAQTLRGSPGKRILPAEADVRQASRQSLVITRDIPAGRPIAEDDLTTQRPAAGISAAEWPRILGRIPNRALPAGHLLKWDDLQPPAF